MCLLGEREEPYACCSGRHHDRIAPERQDRPDRRGRSGAHPVALYRNASQSDRPANLPSVLLGAVPCAAGVIPLARVTVASVTVALNAHLR